MPELNFDGHNTLYATHGLHAYAAKCPPQLLRYGLRYYSKLGETVMDPMAGSGTTLVEARLLGRNVIGYDIDPLARLIAQLKSRVVTSLEIDVAYEMVIRRTESDLKTISSPSRAASAIRRARPWILGKLKNKPHECVNSWGRTKVQVTDHEAGSKGRSTMRLSGPR